MKQQVLGNQTGFSLIEVSVAAGVLAVLAVTYMGFMKGNNEATVRIRDANEAQSLTQMINIALAKQTDCLARLHQPGSPEPTAWAPFVLGQAQRAKIFVPTVPPIVIAEDTLDPTTGEPRAFANGRIRYINVVPGKLLATNGTNQTWLASVRVTLAKDKTLGIAVPPAMVPVGFSNPGPNNSVSRDVDVLVQFDTSSNRIKACTTADTKSAFFGDGFNNKWVEFGRVRDGGETITFTKPFSTPPTVVVFHEHVKIDSNARLNVDWAASKTQLVVTTGFNGGFMNNLTYIAYGDAADGSLSRLGIEAGHLKLSGSESQDGLQYFTVPFEAGSPAAPTYPAVFMIPHKIEWDDSCGGGSCDGVAPVVDIAARVTGISSGNSSFSYHIEIADPGDGNVNIQGVDYIAIGVVRMGADINYPYPAAAKVDRPLRRPPFSNVALSMLFPGSYQFSNPPVVISQPMAIMRDVNCGNSGGVIATPWEGGVSGGTMTFNGDNDCNRHEESRASFLALGN